VSSRIQSVNSLIKNELSRILLKEADFPEDVLVTLIGVDTSTDLGQAKIYISAMPDNKISEVLGILNKNIYKLQKTLDKRLRMRPVPRIVFEKEEKTKKADKVEELLERLKKEEK
jgi:ribosome-binding factor A